VFPPQSPQLRQNGFLSVLSSIGETKVRQVEDDSHFVFDQKFSVEKGSVMVRYHDATTSSFVAIFKAQSLHIFTS
jgi:hypothetical protein